MSNLEEILDKYKDKSKIIISDGVFSKDASIAKIDSIVELAKKYDSLVMIDDC